MKVNKNIYYFIISLFIIGIISLIIYDMNNESKNTEVIEYQQVTEVYYQSTDNSSLSDEMTYRLIDSMFPSGTTIFILWLLMTIAMFVWGFIKKENDQW